MTAVYRGKVSYNYPLAPTDKGWLEIRDQPYPVVILTGAGPDFDHAGLHVLVVADPDQGGHVDLLADLDYYGDDRHVATVGEWHALLRAAAVTLRATLAQRDEARAQRDKSNARQEFYGKDAAYHQRKRQAAEARVAELEAAGERLMSTTAKSTLTWRSDRVAANDARRAWRALVSPLTAPDDGNWHTTWADLTENPDA